MSKKLSVGKRMLAFVLTFVMAFTAISWGDVGEVKAGETKTQILMSETFGSDGWSSENWNITSSQEVVLSVVSSSETSEADSDKMLCINYGADGNAWIYTNEISVKSGHTYTLKGKAKQSTEKTAKLYAGDGMTGNDMWLPWGGANWTEFSYTYTATSDSNKSLGFGVWSEAETIIYMDDLSVVDSWEENESTGPSDDKTETITVYERNFSGTNENLDEWNVIQTLGTNKIEASCWKLWNADAIDATLTTTVTGLSEGTYYLSVTPEGEGMNASTIQINNGEAKTLTINGWGSEVENKTDALDLRMH